MLTIKTLLASFMIWINAHTGLTIPHLPDIMFKNDEQLFHMVYPGVKYEGPEKSVNVMGVYISDTIYLLNDFDVNDIWDQSILLHELIHHYQEYNDIEDLHECPQRREYHAIMIQKEWLDQQDKNIWEYLSPLWVLGTMSCPGLMGDGRAR